MYWFHSWIFLEEGLYFINIGILRTYHKNVNQKQFKLELKTRFLKVLVFVQQ